MEWYSLFEQYDIVYMAKVFNFTPDYEQAIPNARQIIRGGTGYTDDRVDMKELPIEIDSMQPDYTLYFDWDSKIALGFLTRGCIRKCSWCIVPKKEGHIHQYMDIEDVLNGRKKAVLMDNNILAAGDYGMEQLDKIAYNKYRVDFNQALDARLVNQDNAKLLAKIKWLDHRRIRFGCDTPAQIEECHKAIDLINSYGFRGNYFLYTIIGAPGSTMQADIDRLDHWAEYEWSIREGWINGNNVFIHTQPYRDPANPRHVIPQWQKDAAYWSNRKQLFYTTSFEDFSPRKGFKCGQYFDN